MKTRIGVWLAAVVKVSAVAAAAMIAVASGAVSAASLTLRPFPAMLKLHIPEFIVSRVVQTKDGPKVVKEQWHQIAVKQTPTVKSSKPAAGTVYFLTKNRPSGPRAEQVKTVVTDCMGNTFLVEKIPLETRLLIHWEDRKMTIRTKQGDNDVTYHVATKIDYDCEGPQEP